jgi:hypothetical protein
MLSAAKDYFIARYFVRVTASELHITCLALLAASIIVLSSDHHVFQKNPSVTFHNIWSVYHQLIGLFHHEWTAHFWFKIYFDQFGTCRRNVQISYANQLTIDCLLIFLARFRCYQLK